MLFSAPRLFLLVWLALVGMATAQAQEKLSPSEREISRQERGLLQRIMNPDRTLRYEPASRKFNGGSSSATINKRASLRTFPFSKPVSTKVFVSKNFAGSAGFGTKDFARRNRAAVTGDHTTASGTERTFNTRAVAVRDAPETSRTFASREVSTRPFLVRGKRQETLDEEARTHSMSIDEVRELLNKNR